jgi:hypothetical protein
MGLRVLSRRGQPASGPIVPWVPRISGRSLFIDGRQFKSLTFDYYHCTRRFIDMFYPQANPYSQFGFNPQSFNPQSFNPQSFNPQGFAPQGSIPQYGYGALGLNALPGSIYGVQGQQGQHGLQQVPAPQLGPQPFAPQQFAGPFGLSGPSGVNGAGNGIAAAGWAQPQTQFGSQPLFGQINPQQPQYPQPHLLQQIAQYHYLVAQQLAQLAAQQSGQNVHPTAGQFPMAGQFNPGQQGSYIPGFTMH